eukprot:TRINITY_DN607_c0_g1_i11.p2 TRINITY_DN607_c0_g1~~TRINITY_DN607_c0_g1_i11.p2  ORF type:complete len:113 (-),score=20.95 TRINITY_DN607_c0_g1_i11:198-536(-)
MTANLNYSRASKSMFGIQNNSVRSSAPAPGFGTSSHNPNVYISQDHEKTNYGRIGPGPAQYNSTNIWEQNGREVNSTKTSAPTAKMSKSSRFYTVKDPKLPEGTPGPGHYVY